MKKLSVEIPDETLFKLNKLLDWGLRGEVYRQLTRLLVSALETDPGFAQDLINGRIGFIERDTNSDGPAHSRDKNLSC